MLYFLKKRDHLRALLFLSCMTGSFGLAALRMTTFAEAADSSADSFNEKACERHLLKITPSGREDPELFKKYEEAAGIIFGPEGIAKQLGLRMPPHHISFVPSGQLSVLATMSRHAAPHWYDGATIVKSVQEVAGVIEYVVPGCPMHRSYYSDTTGEMMQVSTMMHVAGHLDMFLSSFYNAVSPNDKMARSMELADLMTELYREVDHDEIALFYQHLLSLAELQDFALGSFEPIEKFKPEMKKREHVVHTSEPAGFFGRAEEDSSPYSPATHPVTPTPSALQAIVANLPAEAPEWKMKMATLFEEMVRLTGTVARNKIMHEGWATFMEYIITAHSPWRSSSDLISFAQAAALIAVPAFSNPYWIGTEGWKNLYEKFVKRPEMKDLPRLDQDRKFIEYAHTIMAWASDTEFLELALDEGWVFKQKLFLYRKADYGREEWDPDLPVGHGETQYIVVSRDPKRIVQYLSRRLAERRFYFPRIFLENLKAAGGGVAHFRHEIFEKIPLELHSAAQALFVISQVLEKPVALSTIATSFWIHRSSWDPRERGWLLKWEPPTEEMTIHPIRILVEPHGKVTVTQAGPLENPPDYDNFDETRKIQELNEELQEAVDAYQEDISTAVNEDLLKHRNRVFAPMMEQTVDRLLQPAMNLLSHAPTADRALLEYAAMLKQRLFRMLRLAVQGKKKFRKTKSGLRLKVLPHVPEFKFDRRVMRWIWENHPPAPKDPEPEGLFMKITGKADDVLDLGGGDKLPGDHFVGPDKPRGENGDGDGDGDGPPGPGIGDNPTDPTIVEVPLELYGELLKEELGLQNIRRTDGKSELTRTVRRGGIHRPNGYLLWERTIPEALKYAMLARKKAGRPWRWVPPTVLLREGLRWLQPEDFVVSSRRPEELPDFKAVVVWIIDMSGSMAGERVKAAKEIVWNATALLKAEYEDVTHRYVVFDAAAREVPEEEIWRTYLGGGTVYGTGFEKSEEILNEYDSSKVNFYVFGLGDGEAGDTERTMASIHRLYPRVQYMGFAHTDLNTWGGSGWENDFLKPIEQMAREKEWFGYAHVKEPGFLSVMNVLKVFFGKKKDVPQH